MHHAVPETAGCRVDLLTDSMRLVEKVVHQPRRGQASAGHIAIDDLRMLKRRINRRLFQHAPLPSIWPPAVQRPVAIDVHQRSENRTIGRWIKARHSNLLQW